MNTNVTNATITTAPSRTYPSSQLGTSECDGRSYVLQFAAEFVEKMHSLRHTLETDLLACDAKWTLFVAAALSYRYDSQLKPFPPRFVSEQTGHNIDALVSVINDTPKLRIVLQNIIDQNYEEFDGEVLDLLHWVLVDMRDPALRLVEDEEFESLMNTINQKPEPDAVRPTHVFKVCQPLSSRSEEDFQTQTSQYPSKLAFYGNKLDCFLSLINYGFKQYQCNTNAYVGEMLQLTTELSASLACSPSGAGWGASSCGSMIACVALCEFVNNPEYVERKPTNTGDSAAMEMTLRNSDMARIRYLLFYGSRLPDDDCTHGNLLSWLRSHKYSLSLACYMLLLASIGVANSGSGQYLKHLFRCKALLILDFCKRIFVAD